MELKDLILTPLFFTLLIMVGLFIQEVGYRNQPYKNYFIGGLLFKLCGALAFCSVYNFYYNGGDTNVYHWGSTWVWEHFLSDPTDATRIALTPSDALDPRNRGIATATHFYHNESTYMVVRFASILSVFTFNSFWAISLLFAFLSFSGLWALYRVFVDNYPKLYKELAIAVFFLPSVFFWGSGIMKDSLSIGALGWFVYSFYYFFIKRDQFILPLILLPICFLLIAVLKIYIILGIIPALFYWLLTHYYQQIKNPPLKAMVAGLFITTVVGLSVLAYQNIQFLFWQAFDVFVSRAATFQSWHSYLESTRGQTGYSLGIINFTPMGIIAKIPASLTATFFRPFLYEVRNPVMLLTALESTVLMGLTVYVFLKVGILKTFALIVNKPLIAACVIFAFFFGFAVGFTTYNFGALARYKIPCLPFYLAALFMLLSYKKEKNSTSNS